MPKVKKPGWTYIYSETLKQEIAIHNKTGWAVCEDGVRYSPTELDELIRTHNKIPLQVHLLKKTFSGTVMSAGKK